MKSTTELRIVSTFDQGIVHLIRILDEDGRSRIRDLISVDKISCLVEEIDLVIRPPPTPFPLPVELVSMPTMRHEQIHHIPDETVFHIERTDLGRSLFFFVSWERGDDQKSLRASRKDGGWLCVGWGDV